MTNTQYRHIGQAVELIGILNKRNLADYQLKSELVQHLTAAGINNDAASKFVRMRYGELYASLKAYRELEEFISAMAGKGGAK